MAADASSRPVPSTLFLLCRTCPCLQMPDFGPDMKSNWRKRLPFVLLWSRLGLAPVFPLCAWRLDPAFAGPVLVAFLVWAVVSDVFDGILARRFGVSSQDMRRWDSNVDTVFWLSAIGTLVALHHAWFLPRWPWIAFVAALEATTYAVSWIRFHKEPATHTLAAKFWTLLLLAFLVEICLTGRGDHLWPACLAGAVFVRLEVVAILLSIRTWTSDIPHLSAAWGLRRGRPIRRNKLFHG